MQENILQQPSLGTMVMIPQSVWEEYTEKMNQCLHLLQKKSEEEAQQEWLESEAARKLVKVCAKTWQEYRNKRIIPFSQFGRKIYFKKADIEAFMKSHYIKQH